MQEILKNLALIDATTYCKEHNIDCSGTYLIKYPRKFTYALVRQDNGKPIIETTFYKNRTPSRVVHNQ